MTSSVTIITPPAEEPVNVDEMKGHLRLRGDDGSHDFLICNLIAAATQMIERDINRSLITRTLRLHLDQFPRVIYLPKPPTISITAVNYLDTASQPQALDPADYHLDAAHTPARMEPATAWPDTKRLMGSVWIDYQAGYGTPSQVPPDLCAAIKMLAAHLYENPEATTTLKLEAVPMAVKTITDSYRMPEGW